MSPLLSVSLPLHLKPADQSIGASRLRYGLHIIMAQVSPAGFRRPRTSKHARASKAHDYRIDNIARIAAIGPRGKVNILEPAA